MAPELSNQAPPTNIAIELDILPGDSGNVGTITARSPETPAELDIMFYPGEDTQDYVLRWPSTLSRRDVVSLMLEIARGQQGDVNLVSHTDDDSEELFFGDYTTFVDLLLDRDAQAETANTIIHFGSDLTDLPSGILPGFKQLQLEADDFSFQWTTNSLAEIAEVEGFIVVTDPDLPPEVEWLSGLLLRTMHPDHQVTTAAMIAGYTEILKEHADSHWSV
ncbi:MAG TPA: hypothetical protein VIH90_05530 [Candidatus Saccharimonadales bacterium]